MKKIYAVIFLLIGITSIILGTICYSMEDGHRDFNYSYGTDAYTGIQDGVAQTANNVQYLTEITSFGFGSVLTVAGVFMLVFGIKTLNAENNKEKQAAAPKNSDEPTKEECSEQET